ncbi:MAG: deoxyribodipyrimidine photolyase [Betaproteobacteria bacterium HGW-Betaproteobacteria-2]|nr:MAG: deoxyribodipyrimidine photolyase [Betaproteobacteria bacterium HGW-Betaproteobacteria-2]
MSVSTQRALVWFRRDLRDYDHAALYQALKSSQEVYCTFIFDTEILDQLPDKADRRIEFIWESVRELKLALQQQGADLIVRHGAASIEIPRLAKDLDVAAVFANHDYEPAAIRRDASVADSLIHAGIEFHSFKDQVIFERDEVLTQTGKPYGVFTPYKNAWLKKLDGFYLQPYPVDRYIAHLARWKTAELPSLESMGFKRTNLGSMKLPTGMSGAQRLFEDFIERMPMYQAARDFPAIKGPSYLSMHLRFGTISIRQLARTAWHMGGADAETWLSELIWRDFYFQILHHHPHIAEGHAYKAEFDKLPFPNNETLFQAWCNGRTGYPLVDAAMRQLNQTGWMHNRLRMVTASFLVKDLLIDWRRGEHYFADKLLDFDFSANNGGWQWAASTGCDAQPWFRIFNPVTQSEKFDAEGKFIRKYIPELAACNQKEIHAPWLMPSLRQQELGITIGKDYPMPIVDHATQRVRILALYKQASAAPA